MDKLLLIKKHLLIAVCLLFTVLLNSCASQVKNSAVTLKDAAFSLKKQELAKNSIYNREYSLSIIAETFPEFEWNENAKKGYSIYLQGMNNYYFRKDYETAIIMFFDAMDQSPDDARVYVRLAESQARVNDIPSALRSLSMGESRLSDFMSYPGINEYVEELNSGPPQLDGDTAPDSSAPQGMLGKTTNAILWLPRKALLTVRNIIWLFQ